MKVRLGRISRKYAWLAWQRARKRADMPALRRHDMRRSATQNNRQLGLDKRVRMDLVGHKTTRMTEGVYRHPVTPAVSAAVDPMERLFGGSQTS